jgi:predicted nucleotidyltransferase
MPGVADLQEKIRTELEPHREVLAAYLFGSVARGTSGPLSDVDIAVLLSDEVDPWTVQLDLMSAIASAIGSSDVDVVVLNRAPVSLGYRVLRDGVLLLSRDERARIRHWVATVSSYIDMEPFRRALSEGTHHRIVEGRFGRS